MPRRPVTVALASCRADMGSRRAFWVLRGPPWSRPSPLTVTIPTLAGAALGTVRGLGATAAIDGSLPDPLFVLAVHTTYGCSDQLIVFFTLVDAPDMVPVALNAALQHPVAVFQFREKMCGLSSLP